MKQFNVLVFIGGESSWHRLAMVEATDHDDAESKFRAMLKDGKYVEEEGMVRTIWAVDGALGLRILEQGEVSRFTGF